MNDHLALEFRSEFPGLPDRRVPGPDYPSVPGVAVLDHHPSVPVGNHMIAVSLHHHFAQLRTDRGDLCVIESHHFLSSTSIHLAGFRLKPLEPPQYPFRCNVLRSSPRIFAASLLLPPASLRTRAMWRRSRVARSSASGEVACGVAASRERTSSASISPSARETAPSTTFWSSRTL